MGWWVIPLAAVAGAILGIVLVVAWLRSLGRGGQWFTTRRF